MDFKEKLVFILNFLILINWSLPADTKCSVHVIRFQSLSSSIYGVVISRSTPFYLFIHWQEMQNTLNYI